MNASHTYLNGQVQVITTAQEMRMSHTVYTPKVTDLQSEKVLLDLTGDLRDFPTR